MVVVHAEPRAEGGFGIGRIDHCDARSDVNLLLRPVGWLVIHLADRGEQQVILEHASLGCCAPALEVPLVRVDCGCDLLTLGLIRSLQEGVPEAERDRQVGTNSPGVLEEVFEFVGFEVAAHK